MNSIYAKCRSSLFLCILLCLCSTAQAQNPALPGGPAGLVGYLTVEESQEVDGLQDRGQLSVSATCPEGKVVTGGSCLSTITPAHLFSSYATDAGGIASGIEGWRCRWANWSGVQVTARFSIKAVAFCSNAP